MFARTAAAALSALAIVAASAFMAGCGDDEVSQVRGSGAVAVTATSSGELDLVMPDCSRSFRRYSKQLVPEMVAVALDSAAKRRMLFAGCFAGAPLRHLVWDPRIDFDDLPDAVARNDRMGDRVNKARALGLAKQFEKIIRRTPRRARGSGQLEALELASQTPGLVRVVMFTDALIREPEGISLRTATRSEVEDTVARWAPRMQGLNGVRLVFVGVGLGSLSAKSIRNARHLFGGLARAVGASFSWTRSLPLES